MNTIANRPFPLKHVGFEGYSTFLDGLIPPSDLAIGPVSAETSISTCKTTYLFNPDKVKFRGAFDVSDVWGTDNTEGVKFRLWSSAYERDERFHVERLALELIWSWMDSEPHELCFLKTELKVRDINSATATYALGIIERARKIWPKEIFNTDRWKG